jgi:hypothetical protein
VTNARLLTYPRLVINARLTTVTLPGRLGILPG